MKLKQQIEKYERRVVYRTGKLQTCGRLVSSTCRKTVKESSMVTDTGNLLASAGCSRYAVGQNSEISTRGTTRLKKYVINKLLKGNSKSQISLKSFYTRSTDHFHTTKKFETYDVA